MSSVVLDPAQLVGGVFIVVGIDRTYPQVAVLNKDVEISQEISSTSVQQLVTNNADIPIISLGNTSQTTTQISAYIGKRDETQYIDETLLVLNSLTTASLPVMIITPDSKVSGYVSSCSVKRSVRGHYSVSLTHKEGALLNEV